MMFHRLSIVTPPATPALSLVDAKAHLRVDHDDDDDLIEAMAAAAIAKIDGPDGTGFCLMAQTWAVTLDRFHDRIRLPLRPVVSVSSVTYLDADGATQTVPSADYRLAISGGTGIVEIKPNASWPSVGDFAHPITITFVAGAGVPAALKAALMLIVGDLYANREAQTDRPLTANPAVEALVAPYRGGWVAA